jgi:hypothetical protein
MLLFKLNNKIIRFNFCIALFSLVFISGNTIEGSDYDYIDVKTKRITPCFFTNTELAEDLTLIDQGFASNIENQKKTLHFKNQESNDTTANLIVESVKEINPSNNEFIKDLHLIQQDIFDSRYTAAILALNVLTDRLREQQKKEVALFFPDEFSGFKIWEYSIRLGDFTSQNDNFGVLFSRRYKNNEDHIVDINVVFSDPSIEEYLNIIKKPYLVDNLDNTKVIKVNNHFDALEKYSEDEKYYEQNIIVNRELLLNIVANGIEDKSLIETFTSLIKMEELSNYLSQ